ncbi:MAG TPA: universal stress protein [Candidatus Thermoplasmatota archaeon]|nr:universal stress protein [Candidatus Thermoplasmatota archaeon]
MAYSRVLIATDASQPAAYAARLAMKLADPDGAVRLVSVIAFPDVPGFLAAPVREEILAASAARQAETRQAMAEWARRAGVQGPDVAVREGHVAREIAHEAVDFGADLVAVGSHGAGRVERLILGSTARSVLHHAPCDALVARGEDGAAPAVRRILVATDFYGPSKSAARRAARIAEETGAETILLHAVDPGSWSGVLSDAPGGPGRVDRGWVEKSVAEIVHALNLELFGGKAREVVRQGRAAAAIAKVAHDEGADLIVLGTHGFGPVARAILGSVATGVVEQAPCSVLVSRA